MKQEMKILDLPVKAVWYKMIESGEKPEEYREDKPYWKKRLFSCYSDFDWCKDCVPCNMCSQWRIHKPLRGYTHIRFRYGYTKRTMLFELKDIIIGRGNLRWGAPLGKDVIILKLGKRIS